MGIEIVNPGSSGGGGTTVTTPFFPPWSSIAIGTGQSNRVSSANKIAVFQFILPYSQSVTNIILNIIGSDGSNNCDVGIYDTGGTRKCHAGAQLFSSTGAQTFAMTGGAVTLSAGTYLLAITSAATTMTFSGVQCDNTLSGNIFYYSTATTSSAGALPSSITVSASASSSDSNNEIRTAGNLPLFMIT